VDHGSILTVGDVLSCSAERALSYRWTNVDDSVIHGGEKVTISQPGTFSYECTGLVDCGTVSCPFTRNITGFAAGMSLRLHNFNLKLTRRLLLIVLLPTLSGKLLIAVSLWTLPILRSVFQLNSAHFSASDVVSKIDFVDFFYNIVFSYPGLGRSLISGRRDFKGTIRHLF